MPHRTKAAHLVRHRIDNIKNEYYSSSKQLWLFLETSQLQTKNANQANPSDFHSPGFKCKAVGLYHLLYQNNHSVGIKDVMSSLWLNNMQSWRDFGVHIIKDISSKSLKLKSTKESIRRSSSRKLISYKKVLSSFVILNMVYAFISLNSVNKQWHILVNGLSDPR